MSKKFSKKNATFSFIFNIELLHNLSKLLTPRSIYICERKMKQVQLNLTTTIRIKNMYIYRIFA